MVSNNQDEKHAQASDTRFWASRPEPADRQWAEQLRRKGSALLPRAELGQTTGHLRLILCFCKHSLYLGDSRGRPLLEKGPCTFLPGKGLPGAPCLLGGCLYSLPYQTEKLLTSILFSWAESLGIAFSLAA